MLYNAINGEEYEKISHNETTKEIWDKLEVTYERTKKVKKNLLSLLVYEYELFKIKDGEIFAKFGKIIGEFKAAEKT